MRWISECTLCGSKNLAVLYEKVQDYHTAMKGEFTIDICENCGLFFLNPMMDNKELGTYYAGDYYSYYDYVNEKRNISLLKRVWRKMTEVKTYTPDIAEKGKILDVGCGSGDWLYQMKKKGYTVKGCEMSEGAAKLGKKLADIDIFPGQLTDSHFRKEEFDFIRLNHSFEHMNNPNETLDEIFRIMKPGGYMFIGVPNTRSIWSRTFKKHWYYLGAPIHVYNYNADNLCKLIEDHGFKVVKVRYNGNYYGIAGSIEIMRRAKGKRCDLRLLYPLFYVIAKVFNFFKQGDCVEVIATK